MIPNNTRSRAIINYYVRLIQKEARTIEDVPEELKSQVTTLLEAAKDTEAEVVKTEVTEQK